VPVDEQVDDQANQQQGQPVPDDPAQGQAPELGMSLTTTEVQGQSHHNRLQPEQAVNHELVVTLDRALLVRQRMSTVVVPSINLPVEITEPNEWLPEKRSDDPLEQPLHGSLGVDAEENNGKQADDAATTHYHQVEQKYFHLPADHHAHNHQPDDHGGQEIKLNHGPDHSLIEQLVDHSSGGEVQEVQHRQDQHPHPEHPLPVQAE